MKPILFLILTLAVTLFAGEKSAIAQQYYGPPPFAHGQHEAEEAWEHRGFYDGMEGAEHDFRNHRRPDVNNRKEYRDPDSIPGFGRSITAMAREKATMGTGNSRSNHSSDA